MNPDSKIYLNAFECSPDGIIICDLNAKIILTNKAAFSMFGYEPGELEGKFIKDLIPPHLRDKHKFHFQSFISHPSARTMSNNMKLLGYKKDSSNINISIALNVIQNDPGKELILAVIREITDWVRKTEELEKVSDQLKEALQLSRLGHWDFDIAVNTIHWSPEVYEIFELDQDAFNSTNENFEMLVHEEDREFVKQSYQNSIINQIPYNIVHRYITPNGEIKFLRERGRHIYDADGLAVKTIGTVQDVTEAQKQKLLLNDYILKLERKNKELEDYTHIATHDLQEPVNNIRGIISLLREEFDSSSPTKEEIAYFMDLITRASERLSTLIRGLMETARLGQINPISEVDCNQLLSEVIEGLHFQFDNNSAKITYPPLPVLKGYRFELGLLFQNLISNGLKYCRKEVAPVIKIDYYNQGVDWLFTVEDNGIGIDPVHKDKLFKMFRRLHSQDDIEGTGIGLVQCKKIVEQHNGEIWFESEPGKGTVFYFTLRKNNS